MAFEVKSGPNRPSFDLFYHEGMKAARSKRETGIILWNPEHWTVGPVWHLRANWVDYNPRIRCAEDHTCMVCRYTKKWNSKQVEVCEKCGESKPRAAFGKATRSHSICRTCRRAQKVSDMRTYRAFLASPTKRCRRCCQVKAKSDGFYRDNRNADGYQSRCKQCTNSTRIERRQRNGK